MARDHEVAGVITQGDQPSGRGLRPQPSPVKTRALELGLRVIQPSRSSDIASAISGIESDLAVVVAYGKILKREVLDIPRLGCLNVHFSLLPRYRGAAPVQWSLVNGEKETGVTVFWLDEGMDTGPVQSRRSVAIDPDEDGVSLMSRLAEMGRALLSECLADIAAGRACREPQVGAPSLAPKLKKEDGRVTFNMSAMEIHNRARGLMPWPRAYVELERRGRGERLVLLQTSVAAGRAENGPAGGGPAGVILLERSGRILIQCSKGGRLWVSQVQPEGKPTMSAGDFLNGMRLKVGQRLPLR